MVDLEIGKLVGWKVSNLGIELSGKISKTMKILASTLFFALLCSLGVFAQSDKIIVPLGGNAFANLQNGISITKKGVENWTNEQANFKVYVRLARTGSLSVALNEVTPMNSQTELSVSVNGQVKKISLTESRQPGESLQVGEWKITDTGYVAIEVKGLKKSAAQFVNIGSLILSGSAIDQKTAYVKDNEGNFFHWGRRGPSVHLNYQIPEKTDAEWFYNELTVPKGEDVIGSYFMANGFGEGYFGIQVNSATERRILFSVWSPFNTDDPKSIPESHQIKMLKKGEGVYTGEFGNEGSGGQSYLRYNWKAGNTYRFLLHGQPAKDSTTTYTAYFFAPELNKWQLIASFKRPQTVTHLKRLHSFLENFIPAYGDRTRKVLFNNQWICDTNGNWISLNIARFTTDNTGNKGYRMDFAGGLSGDSFYLQNGGFFSQYTLPKTVFTRKQIQQKPVIDFSKLP